MLRAANISKRFKRKQLFKDISLNLADKSCWLISGANGSGKTTALKCLAGLSPLTKGIIYFNDEAIKQNLFTYQSKISFIAPYTELFEELSANENIQLFSKAVSIRYSESELSDLLKNFHLPKQGNVTVKNFSSGMKQRLKYLIATIKSPKCIFIDEPTANLDEAGKSFVSAFINEWKEKSLILIATNESSELSWGELVLELP